MDREEIKTILPHREPMLLLDSAERIDATHAKASYRVRGDEFFLQGHFPGNPIVPGVIQCEIMAQASCILFAGELGNEVLPLYTGLDKVRFKDSIHPGDVIDIEVRVKEVRKPFYFMTGQLRVDNRLCMKGDFSFTIA